MSCSRERPPIYRAETVIKFTSDSLGYNIEYLKSKALLDQTKERFDPISNDTIIQNFEVQVVNKTSGTYRLVFQHDNRDTVITFLDTMLQVIVNKELDRKRKRREQALEYLEVQLEEVKQHLDSCDNYLFVESLAEDSKRQRLQRQYDLNEKFYLRLMEKRIQIQLDYFEQVEFMDVLSPPTLFVN